jgi:hypothetical protein
MAFFSSKTASELASSLKLTTEREQKSRKERPHRSTRSFNFDPTDSLARAGKQRRSNSSRGGDSNEMQSVLPYSMSSIYSQLASPQFTATLSLPQLVLYDLTTFLESLGVHDVAVAIAGLVRLEIERAWFVLICFIFICVMCFYLTTTCHFRSYIQKEKLKCHEEIGPCCWVSGYDVLTCLWLLAPSYKLVNNLVEQIARTYDPLNSMMAVEFACLLACLLVCLFVYLLVCLLLALV